MHYAHVTALHVQADDAGQDEALADRLAVASPGIDRSPHNGVRVCDTNKQAQLMMTNPIDATRRGSKRRNINTASGQKMSWGTAIQIVV